MQLYHFPKIKYAKKLIVLIQNKKKLKKNMRSVSKSQTRLPTSGTTVLANPA